MMKRQCDVQVDAAKPSACKLQIRKKISATGGRTGSIRGEDFVCVLACSFSNGLQGSF